MEKDVSCVAINDNQSSNPAEAPVWIRSGGLSASDWATITEYQNCLELLKFAKKRLEGRNDSSSFGAIYMRCYRSLNIYCAAWRNLRSRTLTAILALIQRRPKVIITPYSTYSSLMVDCTNHFHSNLRAAWHKASDYYNKLDDSPIYYPATCLHPYYKY
ncbi:hypothetical protein IG631_23329 [Alternaria alternata]|nr:hypothetical protein IG631_23329 [Alternaria alternata]